jgi:polyhydroxyalkanoate synthase
MNTRTASDADVAVPLDSLLASGGRTGLLDSFSGSDLISWATSLAKTPAVPLKRAAALGAELGRVVAGASNAAPSRRDRRFTDPAWSTNPALRRAVQAHLAVSEAAMQLVADAELDERTRQRLQLLVENLIDALAPSNNLALNPTAAKEIIDSGGANLLRGLRNIITDMAARPRVPSMVDTSQFDVGMNLAVTKGAVVYRTPVFELIQYASATSQVRETPLLVVPPTINKYYILDLAEGRSLVEFLVSQGIQVFLVSWRNPTARHADWNLDTYIHAVLEALDTVEEVTGCPQAALFGACSGGIISSMVAAHLAATGRTDRLSALSLAVTVLDQARAGTASAFIDRKRADTSIRQSQERGFLDGAILAEVFAWLRPNDLIWNYWVNNYLLGRRPPAFDVLYWNADTTRMPAALHRDFLELSLGNKLITPGEATALGVPVDLSKVTTDAFLVGGQTDHITPWQSCFRTTQLLGGSAEFVLSTSGHIAALVNPPGNPKASFQSMEGGPLTPDSFAASASRQEGSWWGHYAQWLIARSGKAKKAPTRLGSTRLAPLCDAPGTYVMDT